MLTAGEPAQGRGVPPLWELSDGRPVVWLAVPMWTRGIPRGLILLTRPDQEYTATEVGIAAALVGQGSAPLDNALLFHQVEQLAASAGLTGLYNRRHFTTIATDHLARTDQVAAIMVDIDHFKAVNDTFGHAVGDQVIETVARRLAANLREQDLICRYGGEEYAILLPGIGPGQAGLIACQLHAAVAEEPVATTVGPLQVTVSVDLAMPAAEQHLPTLPERADQALYQAKRSDRNQVIST